MELIEMGGLWSPFLRFIKTSAGWLKISPFSIRI